MNKILIIGTATSQILAQIREKYPNEEILFVDNMEEAKKYQQTFGNKEYKSMKIENTILKTMDDLIIREPKIERFQNSNPFPSPHKSSYRSKRY